MSSARTHTAEIEVNSRVIEFARCQPVLRAFGRTGAEFDPLTGALAEQEQVGKRALWASVAGMMLSGVGVQAVLGGLITVGVWLAVGGEINPVTLVAILGLAARFTSPLSELAEYGSAMRMAGAELDRILSVMDTPALPESAAPQPVSMPGRVQLDGVCFSYPGRPVLEGVSFVAEPGSLTALVGPSGSGKTTVTRLLARFYDVDAGVVRVGGVDVRDQSTAELMAQLSLVFQDVYLFDDTLWENVRIGAPTASDDDIREAARTAGLQSVVDRLPAGWQIAGVAQETPALAAASTTSWALREVSSQPVRIFIVRGIRKTALISESSSKSFSGSRSQAAPPPSQTTLRTGQPKLISITA